MNSDESGRFDAADYIDNEEDIEAFLEVVVEEGGDDPAYIARALGVIARARNMSQLSCETGISRGGLNKALSGEGNPTLETKPRMPIQTICWLRVARRRLHASDPKTGKACEG